MKRAQAKNILFSGTIFENRSERSGFCFIRAESPKVRLFCSQKRRFFIYYRTFDTAILTIILCRVIDLVVFNEELNMNKLIVWDFDGVIADSEKLWVSVWLETLKKEKNIILSEDEKLNLLVGIAG
ncbi:MAG: HAD family hydrolase [Alphaproteobacteria bacterium]|nr:HAD family hydrolase [Alphaproteobacteria bacterium]MCQ2735327.1 HAD family hydrolase [Alphaproteobacteria bacterium]